MKELTKNRAELLRIFLTNPEQAFYMQEVGRILGKKPGVFQRTINNMEKEGVLSSRYQGNARYFMANKQYPLYDELKSIVFKTIGVVGSIKDVLLKSGPVDYAFIYGSFAKAAEHTLSDIDIIIIGRCDQDKLIKEMDRLEKSLRREINYKLYTLKDFRRSLRQAEPFLAALLREKKIMIIGAENELRKIY